jgi:adenosylhomocysteine nucleosidase
VAAGRRQTPAQSDLHAWVARGYLETLGTAAVSTSKMTGILTGLRSEAHCIPPAAGRRIVATGGDPERARHAARALIEQGATGLLSFGLAGGLDPKARPGDLLLPEAVVLPGGSQVATDPAWRARLEATLLRSGPIVHRGALAGVDRLLASVKEKRRLREDTGAIAADMESHAIAEAARQAGRPFVVLRAVADPAGQALPEAAEEALGPDGQVRPLAVARGLLGRPHDLPALLALWRQSARAHAALRRAALLAGTALELD